MYVKLNTLCKNSGIQCTYNFDEEELKCSSVPKHVTVNNCISLLTLLQMVEQQSFFSRGSYKLSFSGF